MKTDRKCVICRVDFTYDINNWNDRMFPDNNSCRECQFWYDLWVDRDDTNVARVGNRHFVIGHETKGNKRFNGFGGQLFKIQFDDGRVVETNNLWSQGEIPEVWQTMGMGSNAKMVAV